MRWRTIPSIISTATIRQMPTRYAKYAPLLCASRSATSFPLFSVCAIFNISSLFIPTTPPTFFAKFYCHHYNTAKFTCQYYLQSFLVIFSCGSILAVEQAQYDDMLIVPSQQQWAWSEASGSCWSCVIFSLGRGGSTSWEKALTESARMFWPTACVRWRMTVSSPAPFIPKYLRE